MSVVNNQMKDIAVDAHILAGKIKIKFSELESISKNSVLELSDSADGGFSLVVGDKVVAHGDIEDVDGKFKFIVNEVL